jgi:hypothetical protein
MCGDSESEVAIVVMHLTLPFNIFRLSSRVKRGISWGFLTPRLRSRFGMTSFLLLGFLSAIHVHGEMYPVKLEDLTWDSEQAKTLSRSAQQALSLENVEWNHAQTEHFIYHFQKKWMAERAASESETYYNFIKKDLKIQEDQWEHKGHVFLFEDEKAWKTFIENTGVDRWSGGVCIGNEIFLYSPPGSKPFTGSVLPHELSHLVVNRFVRGRLPVWLNEGVAEQQSRKHFVSYTKPKGFDFLLRPNVVSAEKYIPLQELTAANDYPSDEKKVPVFYTESVRLVQFLIEDHPDQDFLQFLQLMADGVRFENALDRIYGNLYRGFEPFEEKFRDVAISKVKLVEE